MIVERKPEECEKKICGKLIIVVHFIWVKLLIKKKQQQQQQHQQYNTISKTIRGRLIIFLELRVILKRALVTDED